MNCLKSSSSSSCRAASTDIPSPLSPLFPIVHCLWQVFRATFPIGTELLYVDSNWLSCLSLFIWRVPWEYITDEFVLTYSAVSRKKYHHHYHVVPLSRISLTLSRHFSLSFIASGRSSGLHPVSSQSCCIYVLASRRALARPNFGVHRSTSLMSSSLLLQQFPVCLVRLTWIVFVMGGRWPYSWCFVRCCRQDLFNIARNIFLELIICLKMDLALNNQQRLICHKTQTINKNARNVQIPVCKLQNKMCSLRGLMGNSLDCIVKECELQLRHWIQFWTTTLGKTTDFLIPSSAED